jgi:hypothetical protein
MNKTSRNSSRNLSQNDLKNDILSFQTEKKQYLLSKLRTESNNLSIILSFPSQTEKIDSLSHQIEEVQEKW